jgi:hypothetical protein
MTKLEHILVNIIEFYHLKNWSLLTKNLITFKAFLLCALPDWATFIPLSESAIKIDSFTRRFFSISQIPFVVKNGNFFGQSPKYD